MNIAMTTGMNTVIDMCDATSTQIEIPASVLIDLQTDELILGIMCEPGETYTFGDKSYLCLSFL